MKFLKNINHYSAVKIIMFLGILVLFSGMKGHKSNQQAPLKPNIVFIMADDLGEEVLGSYGGESFETPNLDKLASTGMRFTHCYSTPKCSPSRMNILTGRYTFRYPSEWGNLPDSEITFGNLLRDAGYATAVAGKWQMNLLKEDPLHPWKKGFNQYSLWAWHEGPRYYNPLVWENGTLLDDEIENEYGPDVYTNFLIEHIRRNSGKHQRFLAYYPMNLTHFAKQPKEGRPASQEEPPGPDGTYQTYGEMVSAMDERIGRLVEELERLGLRENTLILFTGDNGTPTNVRVRANGEIHQGGKGEMTNGGTHVPLIANWPGQIPEGAVNDALIDFSDFLPSFVELVGGEIPQGKKFDGVSFVPQLLGKDEEHRSWIYTEFRGERWIRNKTWKLYGDGSFYQVATDPLEKNPISENSKVQGASAARENLQETLNQLLSDES